MVMPLIPFEKTLADGSATEGGRPKVAEPNPLAAEHAQLQRDYVSRLYGVGHLDSHCTPDVYILRPQRTVAHQPPWRPWAIAP